VSIDDTLIKTKNSTEIQSCLNLDHSKERLLLLNDGIYFSNYLFYSLISLNYNLIKLNITTIITIIIIYM